MYMYAKISVLYIFNTRVIHSCIQRSYSIEFLCCLIFFFSVYSHRINILHVMKKLRSCSCTRIFNGLFMVSSSQLFSQLPPQVAQSGLYLPWHGSLGSLGCLGPRRITVIWAILIFFFNFNFDLWPFIAISPSPSFFSYLNFEKTNMIARKNNWNK